MHQVAERGGVACSEEVTQLISRWTGYQGRSRFSYRVRVSRAAGIPAE